MDYGLSVGKALLREFEWRRDGSLVVDESPAIPLARRKVFNLILLFIFSIPMRMEEIISNFLIYLLNDGKITYTNCGDGRVAKLQNYTDDTVLGTS